MSEENKLTQEEWDSLFEKAPTEPAESVEESNETSVATEMDPQEDPEYDNQDFVPSSDFTTMENTISNEEIFGTEERDFDADDIINGMKEVDEDGHSTGIMIASLSVCHNVTEDMSLDDVKEEDREHVEDMQIASVKFDMYSLDGHLINLILTADTPKDAYLNDLYQLLNRYRRLQENIAAKGNNTDVPLFTFTAMPGTLNGRGVMSAVFPVAYFRVLNDNCENTSLMMQFYEDSISFVALNISEEEKTDMIAGVMREVEASENTSMFE